MVSSQRPKSLFKVKLIFVSLWELLSFHFPLCLPAYKMHEEGTNKTAGMLSGQQLQRVCCSSRVGPGSQSRGVHRHSRAGRDPRRGCRLTALECKAIADAFPSSELRLFTLLLPEKLGLIST